MELFSKFGFLVYLVRLMKFLVKWFGYGWLGVLGNTDPLWDWETGLVVYVIYPSELGGGWKRSPIRDQDEVGKDSHE